jgi:hypothetical protein
MHLTVQLWEPIPPHLAIDVRKTIHCKSQSVKNSKNYYGSISTFAHLAIPDKCGWESKLLYISDSENERDIHISTSGAGKQSVQNTGTPFGAVWRPISCSVIESSLDSKPEYEALSYTWGNPHYLRWISLNGFDHHITASLVVALQYLRNAGSVRKLWVDDLCINRLDSEERSHQVDQMRSIYQSASTVLAWLGPHRDHSEIGLKLIEELAQPVLQSTPDQTILIGKLDLNAIGPVQNLLYWPY